MLAPQHYAVHLTRGSQETNAWSTARLVNLRMWNMFVAQCPELDVVWQAAQQASRFFVTQDLDFADTRRFAPGTRHGVLLVRIPDGEQNRLAAYLEAWLQTPECEGWVRFVVATPNKLRVLRPE